MKTEDALFLAFIAALFGGLVVAVIATSMRPDTPSIPPECTSPTRIYEPDGAYVLRYDCEGVK